MWDFYAFLWPAVVFCWKLIVFLYELVYELGVFGVAATFVMTIATAKGGTWLAGERGRPALRIIPRFGASYEIPGISSVEGHATSWIGVLFGGLLKILSIIFLGVTVAAGFKLFIFYFVATDR